MGTLPIARIGDAVAGVSVHTMFAPGDPAFTAIPAPPYPVTGQLISNAPDKQLPFTCFIDNAPIALEGALGATAGCLLVPTTVPPSIPSVSPAWNTCEVTDKGHMTPALFQGHAPAAVGAPVQHCYDSGPLPGMKDASVGVITGPGWAGWLL